MSHKIRWQITIPYISLILLVMLGLRAYLSDALPAISRAILLAALLMAFLALLLGLLIAKRIVHPIERLTHAVERMADGDLSERSLPAGEDEIGFLTRAVNRMSAQFQDKMTMLTRERSRLAAVLEHMADGALITDEEGQVLLINPAAARLLSIMEKDAPGRSFAQVVRHHQLIELWRRCQESGEEQIEAVEMSRQGPFLQAIITPLREAIPRGLLVIFQDLTQIRRLETVRRDFISNISHELRTPLASLRALVDTLRDGALEDPPAAQRFLSRVEAEVDVLTQMVQELLELSRIESGQVPLRLRPVPLDEVVIPPVERLRPQAERANLQLVVELSPDTPMVLADAERIQQVVTNLVHNAIKFTPPGGRMDVSAQAAGEEVLVMVKDTGVGISVDDLPRIFERFYKADRARSGGGTGLGLAIAKHIVQGHGGRIWAESTEGKGSTFFFTLLTTGKSSQRNR